MATTPASLAAIFAADTRMTDRQRMERAAEKRAKKKSSGEIGGLIGMGLGALSLTNPATAPFAGAIMSASRGVGNMVGKGEFSASGVMDAAGDLVGGYSDASEKQRKAIQDMLFKKYDYDKMNKAFGRSVKEEK